MKQLCNFEHSGSLFKRNADLDFLHHVPEGEKA